MAGQQRGQRAGHRVRRSGRGRGLALVACLTALGCSGQLRDPLGISDPTNQPAGSDVSSPVFGTWQATILISVRYGDQYDLQKWTTVWYFGRNQHCHFARTTISLVEGIPRTVERDCSFSFGDRVVIITFTETGITQELPYSFPTTSRDKMLLEGIEYERVS